MAAPVGNRDGVPPVVTLADTAEEISWSVAGQDNADRDPVIFLTGVGETPLDSCGFLFSMLARNYRVVSIDLGGVAQAPGGALQLDRLVEHVQRVIDHVVPGRRVSLIGYSTGALVAVAYAAARNATARAVLIAGWVESTVRQRLFVELWQRLSEQDSASLGDFARFSLLSAAVIDDGASDAVDRLQPLGLRRFTDAHVDFMLTTNLAEIAPTIKVPTLVIGAACDSIISIDQARALFATIPDARYVELESGHAVVIERPAEVLSHIDTFLKDPTRYPSGSMIVSAGP
jgi:pimeloyl-ACP methyl ester carboxylesterase